MRQPGDHGLDDAARVIGTRARLATERIAGQGAMAVVELGAAEQIDELTDDFLAKCFGLWIRHSERHYYCFRHKQFGYVCIC